MIVIVNYGMGNLGSIQNMFKKIGAEACISSSPDDIRKADKLVLPGVGAFDNGMSQLELMGLLSVLDDKVRKNKTPVLGICLGMQLMTRSSEEGKKPGLGWIDGETVRFRHAGEAGLKVPHMGWNSVIVKQGECPLQGNVSRIRAFTSFILFTRSARIRRTFCAQPPTGTNSCPRFRRTISWECSSIRKKATSSACGC